MREIGVYLMEHGDTEICLAEELYWRLIGCGQIEGSVLTKNMSNNKKTIFIIIFCIYNISLM